MAKSPTDIEVSPKPATTRLLNKVSWFLHLHGREKAQKYTQRIYLFARFIGSQKNIRDTALTHGPDGAQLNGNLTCLLSLGCCTKLESELNRCSCSILRSILSVSMNRYIYPSLNLREFTLALARANFWRPPFFLDQRDQRKRPKKQDS